MTLLKDRVEIITAHYQTPELIDQLLTTRDAYGYGNITVKIIDNSEGQVYFNQLDKLLLNYQNVVLQRQFHNLHHGLSLHKGITESEKEYLLLLDSDSFFTSEGGIEHLFEVLGEGYIASNVCYVNSAGIAVSSEYSEAYPYKYPHPSISLIKREDYINSPYNYVHHGSPAIEIAMGITGDGQQDKLVDVPNIYNYFGTQRRGTVQRFGYQFESNPYYNPKLRGII